MKSLEQIRRDEAVRAKSRQDEAVRAKHPKKPKIDILAGRKGPSTKRAKAPPGTHRYRVKLNFVFTMPIGKTIDMCTNPTALAMAAVRALTPDAIAVLGNGTAEYTRLDLPELL